MCYTVLNVFKITNDKCVFYTFFFFFTSPRINILSINFLDVSKSL